jgi:peptidoglycan/LPS O-acetylase OafA/YrhL
MSSTVRFEHRPGLDGLRALAVFAVVLFHSGYGWASGGFLGVSLFFTLSGFLITSLLVAEHSATGSVSWRRFYVRRARRLLPASLVCIAMVMAAAPWWTDSQRRRLPGDVLASLGEVANWRAAVAQMSYRDMFEQAASPLAHFWSLSIEEQCYLVVPVIVVLGLRRGRNALMAVLAMAIVASTVAIVSTDDFDVAYNGTHTRAAELLVGALVAVVVAGRRPTGRVVQCAGIGMLAALGALVVTTTLDSAWIVDGGLTVFAAGSALLVVAASGGPLGRLLGWRPLAAVGQVSYGVYLYHWPVFLLMSPSRVGVDGAALLALRLAVVAVVAITSYRLLEQPIRQGRLLVGSRRVVPALVASTLALAFVALVVLPRPAMSATEKALARAEAPVVAFDRASNTSVSQTSAASAPGPATAAVSVDTRPDVVVVGSAQLDLGDLQVANLAVASSVDERCPVARGDETRLPDGAVVSISTCLDVVDRWSAVLGSVSSGPVVLSLGAIDGGVVRRADEAGFPGPGDLTESARRLVWTESEIVRAIDILSDGSRPVVVVDQSGSPPLAGLLARVARARPDVRVVDAASATQAVFAAAGAFEGFPMESVRPVKVLVIGDSTSFLVADALSDAAAGALEVLWAGQQGCPLATVEATRSAPGSPWVEIDCDPWTTKVPPLLTSFGPDAVLFVAGASQLLEHRYVGDSAGHLPGSSGYLAQHDSELGALMDLLAVPDVPLLIADAPPLRVGGFVTKAMTDPDRLAAWNGLIRRWDESRDDVRVWPYADAIIDHESSHGSIRPDGSHPEIEPLTAIARATLVDRLRSLIVELAGPGG